MKSISYLIIAALLVSNGCSGQTKNKENPKENPNNPKTNIRVNKEFDKSGNLIRYDSTYTYFNSTIEKNPWLEDSIFNAFKEHFNKSYFFSKEPYFEHFFFNDSLLMKDFYKNDFFIHRFRNNSEAMDSLFLKMDKLKNDYFEKQFEEYKNEQQLKKN
jgi:hypothetical protein